MLDFEQIFFKNAGENDFMVNQREKGTWKGTWCASYSSDKYLFKVNSNNQVNVLFDVFRVNNKFIMNKFQNINLKF